MEAKSQVINNSSKSNEISDLLNELEKIINFYSYDKDEIEKNIDKITKY